MEQIFHFIFLLLGFVLILLAAHFTAKWVGGKKGRYGVYKYFNIIERMSLGGESFLYLMRIGGSIYILGVTKESIQVLDKLEVSDLTVLSATGVPNAFAGVLNKYLGFKRTDADEKTRNEEHEQS